jgi:hypothetical protein
VNPVHQPSQKRRVLERDKLTRLLSASGVMEHIT